MVAKKATKRRVLTEAQKQKNRERARMYRAKKAETQELKPISTTPESAPETPVVKSDDAQEVTEALTDPRFARDMKKYVDPTDVKDPSGNWVYGMIDPLHRDHVGLQYWQPITWDIVKKEGLEIPFNPIIRSSAEGKGDNLVRQGTLIYARVRREVAEQIRKSNREIALLKVKSVAPKKLAKELNVELARRGLAKDYQMVVLGEDTILIGKR